MDLDGALQSLGTQNNSSVKGVPEVRYQPVRRTFATLLFTIVLQPFLHASDIQRFAPVDVWGLATGSEGPTYLAGNSAIWALDRSGITTVFTLPSPAWVLNIAVAADGSIYYETLDGIFRVTSWHSPTRVGKESDDAYRGGLVASSQSIWYAPEGEDNLVRVDLSGREFRFKFSTYFRALAAGLDDSVWAVDYDRVRRISPDGTVLADTPFPEPFHCCLSRIATADSRGGVWVTSPYERTVLHFDSAGQLTATLTPPMSPGTWVSSMSSSTDGTLFVGGINAIFRYRNGTWSSILFQGPPAPFNGFSCSRFQHYPMVVATDGSLWVGQHGPMGGGIPPECPTPPPELSWALLRIEQTAFHSVKGRAVRH